MNSFLKFTSILTFFQAFGAMTRALKSVSENSRIVLALEGGYDPRGVADCVVEVVAAMAERAPAFVADELESGAQTKHISRLVFIYLRRCSRRAAPFALGFYILATLLTTGCSFCRRVAGSPAHAGCRERNERAAECALETMTVI